MNAVPIFLPLSVSLLVSPFLSHSCEWPRGALSQPTPRPRAATPTAKHTEGTCLHRQLPQPTAGFACEAWNAEIQGIPELSGASWAVNFFSDEIFNSVKISPIHPFALTIRSNLSAPEGQSQSSGCLPPARVWGQGAVWCCEAGEVLGCPTVPSPALSRLGGDFPRTQAWTRMVHEHHVLHVPCKGHKKAPVGAK